MPHVAYHVAKSKAKAKSAGKGKKQKRVDDAQSESGKGKKARKVSTAEQPRLRQTTLSAKAFHKSGSKTSLADLNNLATLAAEKERVPDQQPAQEEFLELAQRVPSIPSDQSEQDRKGKSHIQILTYFVCVDELQEEQPETKVGDLEEVVYSDSEHRDFEAAARTKNSRVEFVDEDLLEASQLQDPDEFSSVNIHRRK